MSSTSELTRILSGTSDGIGSISSTRRDSVDSLPRETRLRSACDSSKRTSYLFAFPYDYESRSEDSHHSAPPKYTRRPFVLTEAQEMNPPTLPSVSPITALLRAAKRVLPTSRRALPLLLAPSGEIPTASERREAGALMEPPPGTQKDFTIFLQ
ncbi:hypothetical protein FB45DRAFT_875518 [Roridomyces roridus]|uniref:Uncharacterized protein n=1 Tax=Roridomyces roridus TaxID=1738132 RepID=A0AAD7B6B8_9AGAR|nr:hypothetical protein FB45DRAFT_877327 [Roridomyces roridus]KAJ7611327.1 hypothetical protein FB45DRAFT_875518 [Roridomyces roridus]